MDLFDAIENRHSYRGPFRDEVIPREDLVRIVQAGLQAPSAKNVQTTTFVIVDEADLVEQIRLMHATNLAVQQASAFIACIVDRQPAPILGKDHYQVEDCAVAVENMLLAITASGYASVWIDGWLRFDNRADVIGRLLGVPEDKVIRVLLPVGAPAERWPQVDKKPFAERAWFNKYGQIGD